MQCHKREQEEKRSQVFLSESLQGLALPDPGGWLGHLGINTMWIIVLLKSNHLLYAIAKVAFGSCAINQAGVCWVTERLALAEILKHHLVQPPSQAGPSRAGCPGRCPAGFWVSASMESLQPLLATYATVWPPSQFKMYFSCAQTMAALGNRMPAWSKLRCCTRRTDKIRRELLFQLAPVTGLRSLLATCVATGRHLIYRPWARKPQTTARNILKQNFVTPEETS